MEPIYQKIEDIIEGIISNLKGEDIQAQLLVSIVDELGPEIGITGGRLWQLERHEHRYVLVKKHKGKKQIPLGFTIPETYLPIQTVRKEGYVCRQKGDKSLDRSLEDKLGVEDFVAVAIGIEAAYIASFDTITEIAAGKRPELLKKQERTLRRIARAAAIALNNAYKHQQALRERDFAYRILLDMLPDHRPRFSGFDIYGKTLFSSKVGGDYYNFIKLPSGHMDLVIADAKGHGLEAAGTISLLHNALLRSMVRTEAQIDEVVIMLNRKLLKRTSEDNFVTMFYGELCPNGDLIYCNAGHSFPLLFQRQSVTELKDGGLILGVLDSTDYEIGQAHLAQGSLLVQYTDGVVEAMNQEHELFGIERLKEIIWENYACSAEEVADKLLGAASLFSGVYNDDMTVVVVKRTS